MKQYKDRGIVLSRVDYGERDRILTLLGAENGKISVLAKAARGQKSRLAGGIELLSETDVTFVDTRSKLKTLTGARLRHHFTSLARDMKRMQVAFEHIRIVNSVADEDAGQEYYPILLTSLAALDDPDLDMKVGDIWFNMRMLRASGSEPNLLSESSETGDSFEFDFNNQHFSPVAQGAFARNDLKLLRLCLNNSRPPRLQTPLGSEDRLLTLTRTLLKTNLTEV